MAIIDPEGLFNGDRLRRCSNTAQLHWPRLFLASDGFARIEINYARIVGRAYPTFEPIPTEEELQQCIQQFVQAHLLFLYEVGGQIWGQWDTRRGLLTRYKTAADRRSPIPPEPAFTEWKRQYQEENKAFPKCFGNLSATFLHGVGVGVGKTICASPDGDSRVGVSSSQGEKPGALFPTEPLEKPARRAGPNLTPEQETWFSAWWSEYWRHTAKKGAREAFRKLVRTEARYLQVMAATRAQLPEMLSRPEDKRPYPTTWLNGERWEDEAGESPRQPAAGGSTYREWEPPTGDEA